MSPRVRALVAARNEEDLIADTVLGLAALVDEVVVVDDGSTDATSHSAMAVGATVINTGSDMGKGGALELAVASVGPADVWLLADGDLGRSAASLAGVMRPVLDEEADMAIAVLPAQGGGFGLVKRFARLMIRSTSGFRAMEPLSGQRALSSRVLEACRPIAGGFGVETGLTIDAARLGFRIVEVPVAVTHRPTGRDLAGFAHRGRQGWDILLAVLPRVLRIR